MAPRIVTSQIADGLAALSTGATPRLESTMPAARSSRRATGPVLKQSPVDESLEAGDKRTLGGLVATYKRQPPQQSSDDMFEQSRVVRAQLAPFDAALGHAGHKMVGGTQMSRGELLETEICLGSNGESCDLRSLPQNRQRRLEQSVELLTKSVNPRYRTLVSVEGDANRMAVSVGVERTLGTEVVIHGG